MEKIIKRLEKQRVHHVILWGVTSLIVSMLFGVDLSESAAVGILISSSVYVRISREIDTWRSIMYLGEYDET